MPLGMEIGLGPADIVLDGNPAPSLQKGAQQPPNFRPMYCGQTAGCIKIPFGTDVGLSTGHIVLDGDQAHPKRGYSSRRQFSDHVYCGQMA